MFKFMNLSGFGQKFVDAVLSALSGLSAIRTLGPGNVSGICPRNQDIDTRE